MGAFLRIWSRANNMSKIYETYHDTVRNSFFWAGFVNNVNFIKMLQEDLNSRKKILKHVATETGAHLCKKLHRN